MLLLNSHPDVFITDEARLFNWVAHSLTILTQDENLLRHYRTEFAGSLRAQYPELIRNFYRELRPAARYWGDKNPHYASPEHPECLTTIHQIFPGARFINIIRDGRDVVTSGLRGMWTDFDSVHEMWNTHIEIGCGFGRTLPTTQYFEIRYEELIRDDLAMAHRLFTFLQIPLTPSVVQFCREQMQERTPFCIPSRNIKNDVFSSDWAKVMTPDQQVRSLNLLGSNLVALGYETKESLALKIQERTGQ